MVNVGTLLLLGILLVSFPLISSTSETFLGTFEKSTDIELLQICSNSTSLCDSCNISSVKYPNSSVSVSNILMTKRSGDFNYSLISNYTGETGSYSVNGFCIAGSEIQVFSYILEITNNGNEKPSENVIVLFVILFTLLVAGLLSLLMYNIFHMITWDFDAKDLIYNISAYFVLFVVYILGKEYLGNSFIDDFLVWVIGVAALTNVILPIIAFTITFIKGGLDYNA